QAEPRRLEEFRKDVPTGLSAIVRKMLAKRPEERYQTPAEVARVLAARKDPVQPSLKVQARYPQLRQLAIGLGLLLVGAAVLGFLISRSTLEKTVTNSIGMKLVLIPEGKFLMGSRDEKNHWGPSDAWPPHEVTISKPFYMGKYEVTQAQYEQVMGENPSFSRGPDLPVEHITWQQAVAFCKKLSEREAEQKRTYRLPTEAEWEYAYRAGSDTLYFFGDAPDQLPKYAWYSQNAENMTHPVAQRTANAWGLHDMAGNVMEFCADSYTPYRADPQVDPAPQLNQAAGFVARGGCYGWSPLYHLNSDARCCTAAFRQKVDGQSDRQIGFRVVMSVR